MKILLSAYSCVPGKGSEPGVGWNAVQQAARFHNVWVLTHGEGRQEIKAALAREPLRNVHFVYLDLPRWAFFWKKDRRGQRVHYYFWQVAAYFVGRRLHRKVGFDLIHHVTFVQYATPSFLVLLPVPFIWGPVGGGESAPRSFWWSYSLRGKVFELARVAARKLCEYDPFVRLTARKASLGLATTEETARQMRTVGCKRVSVLSAVSLSQEEIQHLSLTPARHSGPFRLLSVGRLAHWKGCHLSLRAFAEFHRRFPDSEYWLVGDGPESKRLRELAQRLGVGQSVTFWGNVPRSEVLNKVGNCDILLHPCLHDSGGWASLEAMAAGRPVVCLNLGGLALQITEQTGIKVTANASKEAVNGLAAALLKLAGDPGLRLRMGKASRQRVEEHFACVRKGDFMKTIYENTLLRSAIEVTAAPYATQPGIES